MSALNDPERQKTFAGDVVEAFRKAWEGESIQLISANSGVLFAVQSAFPTHTERIAIVEVKLVVREQEGRLLVVPGMKMAEAKLA